jgi:hypothetical protein
MQINKITPHEYKYTVHEADYKGYNWGGFRCFPAPTLQEILEKFSIWILRSEDNEQQGSCIDVLKEDFEVFKNSPSKFYAVPKTAEEALELWLKLKGIKNA